MIVNKPRQIWMTNDPGGYVRVSDKYLWVKFPDEKEELQFRINGRSLVEKFRIFKHLIIACRGVKLIQSEDSTATEKMLLIEIVRPGEDNFRAEVSQAEFLDALNEALSNIFPPDNIRGNFVKAWTITSGKN